MPREVSQKSSRTFRTNSRVKKPQRHDWNLEGHVTRISLAERGKTPVVDNVAKLHAIGMIKKLGEKTYSL